MRERRRESSYDPERIDQAAATPAGERARRGHALAGRTRDRETRGALAAHAEAGVVGAVLDEQEQSVMRAIFDRRSMFFEWMLAVWRKPCSASTAQSMPSSALFTRATPRTGMSSSVQTKGWSGGTSATIRRTSGPTVTPISLRITAASRPIRFLRVIECLR